MAPLDLIRNGIVTGNWDNVVKGFNILSGESLNPPKVNITAGNGGKKVWTEEELKFLPLKFKGRPNLFEEDEELLNAHKADSEFTKIVTPTGKRHSKRKRPPPKYVEATCKSCSKKLKIRSDLIVRYEKGEASDVYCDNCCQRG